MEALEVLERGVDALAAADLSSWTLEEVQAFAVAAEKLSGRLRGVASRTLGVLEAADPDGVGWWWRDALGITGEAAGHAVRRARALRALPVVEDAVVSGEISLKQAGAFTPLVGRLPEQVLDDLQPSLVAGAASRTHEAIAQWVRILIAENSERDLDLEQAAARAKRYLKLRTTPDGMVRGSFALDGADGELFLTGIEPLARREGLADTRTAGQRRVDAMIDLIGVGVRLGGRESAGRQPAELFYVMSAEWAAGQAGASPATAAWTGPQTRASLEALCCDARISRVLLDGTGQVRGLESLKDGLTRSQRRAVSARDRHCRAPGCCRPPAFCDVHHLTSRADGGPTRVDNLVLLCRRHHMLWHQGALTLADLQLPWTPWSPGPDEPRAGPLVA